MGAKDLIKGLVSSNPIAEARRKKMRRSLKNKEFSLLTPNCMGGILLHDLGLRFLSPTVNLMMLQGDFLDFVMDMDTYLNEPLHFYRHEEYSFPCARISPAGFPEISVHFTHYKTSEEAERKWTERSGRINRDNLFVFIEERDGIGYEDLKRLKSCHARGVLAFTCNEYSDLPYCVYLDKYHRAGEVGNILEKSYLDDSREYERYFDFVKWFNEADGGDFDVSAFIKGK